MSGAREAPSCAAPPHDSKQPLRLWLGVLGCASVIERQVRARLRREFDVTLPQFDVLAEIERAGRPQTMSELSRRLMVSNGNVTGVVDRLVRDGLVRRGTSARDRRVQHVDLTPRGRRTFARVAAAHEAWVAELLDGVSADELALAVPLLRSIRAKIRSNLARDARGGRASAATRPQGGTP